MCILWSSITFFSSSKTQPVDVQVTEFYLRFISVYLSLPLEVLALWSRQRRCTVYIHSSNFGWSRNVAGKFSHGQGGGSRRNKTQRTENSCSTDLRLVVGFFNESLASGQLPDEFKSGLLLPIFESGKTDSQKAENYRGNIPRLHSFKDARKDCSFTVMWPFPIFWHIFRLSVWFSTQPLMLWSPCLYNWRLASRQARDRKLNTAIVFLDLTKAFDNVRHQKFPAVSTECRHGRYSSEIDTPLPHWQTLSTNWPRCTPKGQQSTLHVQQRCPQGSVLGPLLFNVYVSSLQDTARAKSVSLPSFADDFTLYSIRPTMTEAADAEVPSKTSPFYWKKRVWQYQRKKQHQWWLRVLFPPMLPNLLMYLNDSRVKMVSQAVLLGVTVAENLPWSAHIDALHRRICWKIDVLRQTMRQLTSASRRQFLMSVIQPDFEYAAVAFVPSMSLGTMSAGAVEKSCSLRCDGRLESGYCTTSVTGIQLEKARNDTILPVAFNSPLATGNDFGCNEWYIKFNGNECNLPAPISSSLTTIIHRPAHPYHWTLTPAEISGFCSSTSSGTLTPGAVEISVHVRSCRLDSWIGDAHTWPAIFDMG